MIEAIEDNSILEAIRARDADLHYCKTCNNRVYLKELTNGQDRHGFTVEECDERMRVQSQGKRQPDPETGHLCWDTKAHHPFVEGDIPEYEQASVDRRWLLARLDYCESLAGFNDG